MGRRNRKEDRKRQTKRHLPSLDGRRRVVFVAAIAVALAGAVWYAVSVGNRQNSSGQPSLPPEPPPIHPGEVLGLAEAVPDGAEGLRQERRAVCEALVRDLADRPEAHSVLALNRYGAGLKEEAATAWEQALELNPNFSPALLGKGLVAADKGENGQAITALRRAIELNPSLEEGYAKLIEILLRENRTAESLAIGREFVRRFPESRKANYWLGQTCLQLERYEDAVAAHEAVLEHRPDWTLSYYSLSVAHVRLGNREAATKARRTFAELKEKDVERERNQNRTYEDRREQAQALANTHMAAGDVRFASGDAKKAEAHWLRGAAVDAGDLPCRRALSDLYESQSRWRSAAAVAVELAELTPDDAGVLLKLGQCQERLGQAAKAEESYRRSIACDPQSAAAYLELLRHALQTDRPLPDGIALARKAVELTPSADAYVLLGMVLDQSGDRKQALAAVEKALELAPGDPQLRRAYQQLQDAQ